MITRRQQALDMLFVGAEVVAWFMVLRVIATITERTGWSDAAVELERALRAGDLADPSRASVLIPLARAAAEGAFGPPLAVMLLGAFGAFFFVRLLTRSGMDGPVGALVLLLGSVLALNVLLRLAVGGDWRLWDMSGVAGFFEQRDAHFASRLDLDAFVARPSLGSQHGATLIMTFAGMTALWIRFLVAARSSVTFERALRSVSAGFVVVLVVMVAGGLAGVPAVARYAVVHFVVGVLALAVANNARAAATPTEGAQRTAPWVFSVGATVAVLTGVALMIALLAYINVGAALAILGNLALRIIEVLLLLIITPIYWLFDFIFRLVFPDGLAGLGMPPPEVELPREVAEEEGRERQLPGWITNSLQLFAVMVIGMGLYYLARLIMARRRRGEEEGEVVRSRGTGGAGLGEIIRDILPRGRRRRGWGWMARHPVYRLYGRTVLDAHDRGFRAMAGETPIEFSTNASRALSAPFAPVGRAFDQARYGRHYPSEEEVGELERAVERWEVETPVTPELRERMQGARQPSEMESIELRIQQRRGEMREQLDRRRIDPDEQRGRGI